MAMQFAPMKVIAAESLWAEQGRFNHGGLVQEVKIGAPPGLCLPQDSRSRVASTSSSILSLPPPPGLELAWETDSAPGSDRSPSYTSETDASDSGRSPSPAHRSMSETRTTLHIRNLPCCFTRSTLLQLLDAQGLSGEYDFVYLPMDFKTKQSIGYGFVNFRTSTAALLFRAAMHGFSRWAVRSQKVCSVQWSKTQGLEANVKLIIKSRVMSKRCPEEFKPTVFLNGQVVPFPCAQQRL